MNPTQFQRYVVRDGTCYATAGDSDMLIPQHRQNRGMGGSKLRDVPSNIILFDSILNGLIESDNQWARKARLYGWKLESWQDPLTTPVFHTASGWWLLDDEFHRTRAPKASVIEFMELVK